MSVRLAAAASGTCTTPSASTLPNAAEVRLLLPCRREADALEVLPEQRSIKALDGPLDCFRLRGIAQKLETLHALPERRERPCPKPPCRRLLAGDAPHSRHAMPSLLPFFRHRRPTVILVPEFEGPAFALQIKSTTPSAASSMGTKYSVPNRSTRALESGLSGR